SDGVWAGDVAADGVAGPAAVGVAGDPQPATSPTRATSKLERTRIEADYVGGVSRWDPLSSRDGAAELPRADDHRDHAQHHEDDHALQDARVAKVVVEDVARGVDGIEQRVDGGDV